mgnify:CR=1 FL=1
MSISVRPKCWEPTRQSKFETLIPCTCRRTPRDRPARAAGTTSSYRGLPPRGCKWKLARKMCTTNCWRTSTKTSYAWWMEKDEAGHTPNGGRSGRCPQLSHRNVDQGMLRWRGRRSWWGAIWRRRRRSCSRPTWSTSSRMEYSAGEYSQTIVWACWSERRYHRKALSTISTTRSQERWTRPSTVKTPGPTPSWSASQTLEAWPAIPTSEGKTTTITHRMPLVVQRRDAFKAAVPKFSSARTNQMSHFIPACPPEWGSETRCRRRLRKRGIRIELQQDILGLTACRPTAIILRATLTIQITQTWCLSEEAQAIISTYAARKWRQILDQAWTGPRASDWRLISEAHNNKLTMSPRYWAQKKWCQNS